MTADITNGGGEDGGEFGADSGGRVGGDVADRQGRCSCHSLARVSSNMVVMRHHPSS
jgi:hypothetical protein